MFERSENNNSSRVLSSEQHYYFRVAFGQLSGNVFRSFEQFLDNFWAIFARIVAVSKEPLGIFGTTLGQFLDNFVAIFGELLGIFGELFCSSCRTFSQVFAKLWGTFWRTFGQFLVIYGAVFGENLGSF